MSLHLPSNLIIYLPGSRQDHKTIITRKDCHSSGVINGWAATAATAGDGGGSGGGGGRKKEKKKRKKGERNEKKVDVKYFNT